MTTIKFDNSYAKLPAVFYAPQALSPTPDPKLIKLNEGLATEMGLDADYLKSAAGIALLSGGDAPNSATPIAMAYAGHQFGGWSPQLGDGRAVLLGEVITPDGARLDLHLKGSGRTKYSRGGDGKAGIGPVLREYILSEAMYALGVPTTRTLGAVTTGEDVFRQHSEAGAVLARVAQSHIRVGTFPLKSFSTTSFLNAVKKDFLRADEVPTTAPSLRANRRFVSTAFLSIRSRSFGSSRAVTAAILNPLGWSVSRSLWE